MSRKYVWVFTHIDTAYEPNSDPTVLIFGTKRDALKTMYENAATHFGLPADAKYGDIKRSLLNEELIIPSGADSEEYTEWQLKGVCNPNYIRVYEEEGFVTIWSVEKHTILPEKEVER